MSNRNSTAESVDDDPQRSSPSNLESYPSLSNEEFELLMAGAQEPTTDLQLFDSWPTSPEEVPIIQSDPSNLFHSPFSGPFTSNTITAPVAYDYFSVPPSYTVNRNESIDEAQELPLFTTAAASSASSSKVASTTSPPSTMTSPITAPGHHPTRLNALLPRDLDTQQQEPTSPTSNTRRQAHNIVERKYRDSLNTEMERLRMAVPTIRSLDSDGRARPSKAMVLAAAADYIRQLEAQLEELRRGDTEKKEPGNSEKGRRRRS